MEGRPREKPSACVRANELIKRSTFSCFCQMQNDDSCKIDKLLISFFFSSRKSTLIGAVRLLHRAVSASSHSPSAAHTLAHLTQEILKTVCYFCLIIHLNRTSYTKPTRSAAYSSDVSLCFFLHFCRSECSWNGTFNHRHRAGRSTLINADAEGRRVL